MHTFVINLGCVLLAAHHLGKFTGNIDTCEWTDFQSASEPHWLILYSIGDCVFHCVALRPIPDIEGNPDRTFHEFDGEIATQQIHVIIYYAN